MRSTSGYVLMLNGAAVSWRCKRQSVFALSSAEAESIAASSMVQEDIFANFLLTLVSSKMVLLQFLLIMRRAFIGPKAQLVAVISASILFTMHVSGQPGILH